MSREAVERKKRQATAERTAASERSDNQREAASIRRAQGHEAWRARRDESRGRQHAGVSRAVRDRDVSLLDLIDRLLDGGVVIHGDITLAVADVDLLYVGLRAMVASVETIERELGVSLSARSPSLKSSAL
jgi:gas vesicle structural protein